MKKLDFDKFPLIQHSFNVISLTYHLTSYGGYFLLGLTSPSFFRNFASSCLYFLLCVDGYGRLIKYGGI